MARDLLQSIDQRTRLAGHNRLALLLFRLGGRQVFGVNVFKVQEVLHAPKVSWMPSSHPLVRGVVDVRGKTVPVLDLATAIQHDTEGAALPYIVVTEFSRSVQGFPVASVERIINTSVAEVETPPDVGSEQSFLTAVTRYQGELIQILDLEKVLAGVVLQPSDLSPELIARGEAGQRLRVLVVDDSRVARAQIERVLEQLGADATLLTDGRQALQHLQSLADQGERPSQRYAMIISDIEMPDMDGYTLTTEIRRDPRLADLYVLLHTSLSGIFNNAMVGRVGADKFVPKYSPDELARAVLERFEALEAKAAA